MIICQMSEHETDNQEELNTVTSEEKEESSDGKNELTEGKDDSNEGEDDENDEDDEEDEDENESSENDEGEEDEDESSENVYIESESDSDVIVASNTENIINDAALLSMFRAPNKEYTTTKNGKYVAHLTLSTNKSIKPWDIVNPSGIHPYELKSIFDYDIKSIPEEERPWRQKDADITDWFNYGFDEDTWEIYRQQMLKIIQTKNFLAKINVH